MDESNRNSRQPDLARLILEIRDENSGSFESGFRFEGVLSFESLIAYIRSVAETDKGSRGKFAGDIMKSLQDAEPLNKSIRDLSVLEDYRPLINEMMMFVFPDAFYTRQTFAATIPFTEEFFYYSPRFGEITGCSNGRINGKRNIDDDLYDYGKNIAAYAAILGKFYNIETIFTLPIIYNIPEPVHGLDRHYKLNMANEFLNVTAVSELPVLSKEQIEEAKSRIYDVEFLSGIFKDDSFLFSGFLGVNLINITDSMIISEVKNDLLERNSIAGIAGFLKLQHKLRSLLNCPEMQLGLSEFSETDSGTNYRIDKIGHSFLAGVCNCNSGNISAQSVYAKALAEKRMIICRDIVLYEGMTETERMLYESSIRNILIAPLYHDGEAVRLLELCSEIPGTISPLNAMKLRELFPLLAMSIANLKHERNSNIQSVIKEKCTAIHPSLEWRFRVAARNYLFAKERGDVAEMEDIVFEDVYPLYGLSDIRNSSLERNRAIKEDLIESLEAAAYALSRFGNSGENLAIQQLTHMINIKKDELKYGIDSFDDQSLVYFIRNEISPVIDHCGSLNETEKKISDEYNALMDQTVGIVYKRRKQFEESTTKISKMISMHLDQEQKKVQESFPHYFERFKTDGVDHTIYVGQSLVKDRKFEMIYLRNLRLWQLDIMCQIVRKSFEIKSSLPAQLDTAHLILVQSQPLSIRFRYDEKKFDVDGAYNIRYEIMKKRIDKAEVKGREERLTQPGKIAIVYSAKPEENEYVEYIRFLQSKGVLKQVIEKLEVEELQGVSNLKALRVEVKINEPGEKDNDGKTEFVVSGNPLQVK